MKAYTGFSTRVTPQFEAIPGQKQVQNNEGGFVYELGAFKRLERFLILGSEGGTYYTTAKKLTKENALNVIKAIETDSRRAVDLIVSVSDGNRAPNNDPAIFALALAAAAVDPATRQMALAALPKVCRIPTHLFHFVTFVRQFRGFGRGLKTAIGKWYQEIPTDKLAYEVVKYQSRDNWSNADLLRLAHPKTTDPERNALYKWIVDGWDELVADEAAPIPEIIAAFEAAKKGGDLPELIRRHNLSREMLPTESLNRPGVWEALLEKMPPHALLRNLGNMSKVGLLKPLSSASRLVVDKLHDGEALRKKRVHPVAVLIALKQYSEGHGRLGGGVWTPVPAVIDALDDAFYLVFNSIKPSGKRLLFGLDVSGSMAAPCAGTTLTCAEGAAAMALACAKVEKDYYIAGFAGDVKKNGWWTGNDRTVLRDLGITPRMRMNDVLAITRGMTFGPTDCSLPMVWATANKAEVDGFVVITDNETYHGVMHPSQALRQYREKSGIDAKQVVIGMTATNFTIADPNDTGSLDVAGFDANVPQVITEFMR